MGFVNTVSAHFFCEICGFYQKSADCAENIAKYSLFSKIYQKKSDKFYIRSFAKGIIVIKYLNFVCVCIR